MMKTLVTAVLGVVIVGVIGYLGFELLMPEGEQLDSDRLIILSPHRKSLQNEFIPAFRDYYVEKFGRQVRVDWLDQGGTSDDIRFLRAKFGSNPDTAGIDIFWGGGASAFLELQRDGFLASYELPENLKREVPQTVAGIPLYDATKTWYGSAMSSFGIFYNKRLMDREGMEHPAVWSDLADAKYLNKLSLADPRRSGSATTLNIIVLESMGWDAGWLLLTKIAGNNRSFTHSSSDPIRAVVTGDALASMAIDFYALSQIARIGTDSLGFVMPEGQTVLDPDPVAIVKGAPNREVAERFVEFVLGAEAQQLLVLPEGSEGGPKMSALGRLATNERTYDLTEGRRLSDINPFTAKEALKLDLNKVARMQRIFNDLIGSIHIDTHHDLKKAWEAILASGEEPSEVQEFGKPPVTEREMMRLIDRWDDDVFRNETINSWISQSRAKYVRLASSTN